MKNLNICPYCKDKGLIQVEVPYKNTYTTVCKRCVCIAGSVLNKSIRQITKDELNNISKGGKIIRNSNFHNDEYNQDCSDNINKFLGNIMNE